VGYPYSVKCTARIAIMGLWSYAYGAVGLFGRYLARSSQRLSTKYGARLQLHAGLLVLQSTTVLSAEKNSIHTGKHQETQLSLNGRAQHHVKVFPVEYDSRNMLIAVTWRPAVVNDFTHYTLCIWYADVKPCSTRERSLKLNMLVAWHSDRTSLRRSLTGDLSLWVNRPL